MTQNTQTILESDNICLRPLSVDDAKALVEVFSDEDAMRFMPSVPHKNLAETEAHISAELSNPLAHHWAIHLKQENRIIGMVNYLGGTPIPGMGYILHRDYWGQGLATEACRVAIEYGFSELGLTQIELWIDEKNSASRRVATKLGFGLKGRIPLRYAHKQHQSMMLTYGLWKHDWSGQAAPTTTPSFHNVQPVLLVHDVLSSAEFYRDKLNFRIDFLFGHPPTHAGISQGNWTGTGVTIQLSQAESTTTTSVSTYLYITVSSDIDQLFDTYTANGVDIVNPPETYPWGMREFTIRDPNGHILRLGTHATQA